MVGAVALAAVELIIAILLAHWIGGLWTVLIILALSLLGGVLLRREGLRSWRRFRAAAQAGDRPGPEVVNGLVGLGGALLLFLPGLLTGVVGLFLLLPLTRRAAGSALQSLAARRLSARAMSDFFGPRRVRAQRGPTVATTPGPTTSSGPPATPPRTTSGTDVIEGEVVD
jgi:UPF0716 protein FxsA